MRLLAALDWSMPIADPVLAMAVVMLIILVAPLLAERLRMPGIIGLIVAGILVGPHSLNLLDRNDTILMLGTAGLLFIVFVAGLEIDLNQFRKYRSHSLVFGTTTFLVPQVLGTIMALYVLEFTWPQAILLASMFASHTLLTYPIASRLGLARNRAVATTTGGSIISDTSALLVLAVVARSVEGELGVRFWTTLVLSLLVYVAVVWWLVPWLARWFFRVVDPRGIAHFVFMMASLFTCAYLARVAGVEPIVGAFLAGLALNRLVPEHSVQMNRVQFAGSWFFIPIFLISVGMLVDPLSLATDITAWKVSLAMTATVIFTKFLAAFIASRILGYSGAERAVMFGLSVNQAAATLAAIVVAIRLEIFTDMGDSVLNGTVMMILVTCLIGPWVTQRYGLHIAQEQERNPLQPGAAPQRILVPLRNPAGAEAIMDVAMMLRGKKTPDPLYALTVAQDGDDATAQIAAGEKMLGYAVMHAAAADVPVSPATRLDVNPAAGIARAARELRVSTIVMGWTGTSRARDRIFGSVLDQLLEQCPHQFVVCRIVSPLATASRLVLAIPPHAEHEIGFDEAIGTIKNLAQQLGVTLIISANHSHILRLKPLLEAIRPTVPTEFQPVNSIDEWLLPGDPVVADGDLFVLLSAREGRVSWRPSVDRMPRRLVFKTPGVSLLVVYPSEVTEIDETRPEPADTPDEVRLSMLFVPARISLQIKARDLHDVTERLLKPHFSDRPTALRDVSEALERLGREAPLEITPGVVLLHTRTAHIASATAFLATIKGGLRLPNMRQPTHSVFVLLSPLSISPEAHLRCLARIAHLLHNPADIERIAAATSTDELQTLLDIELPGE